MNSEFKIDTISDINAMLSLMDTGQLMDVADMIHAHAEVSTSPRYAKGRRAYSLLTVLIDDPIIIGGE